jgi:hypothetical protein
MADYIAIYEQTAGRLTTCYARAEKSQGKLVAGIKLILQKTINLHNP